MDTWKTAITETQKNSIRISGYDIVELMTERGYIDTVFLLHRGRLPEAAEHRVLNAVLVAVADHGPGSPSVAAARVAASGNRAAPEAAVAAGILAIGDAHAGAGHACMTLIETGLARVERGAMSVAEAARATVVDARERGIRLPGIGHRQHTVDPRTVALFALARETGVAADGIAFVEALGEAVSQLVKPMPVNLDGALAAVLFDLGFPPLFAKLVFMIGRVAGLSAHVMEEYTRERPMRIHIPVSYDGPGHRGAD